MDTRRKQLHAYLQEIVNRPDMRTDPRFRAFICLDSHVPESVIFSPLKIGEMNNLPLGGRDFVYSVKRNLLFVAMSDMKLATRLDSYITNFTMPWESKEETANAVTAIVGAVACYKVTIKEDDTWTF